MKTFKTFLNEAPLDPQLKTKWNRELINIKKNSETDDTDTYAKKIYDTFINYAIQQIKEKKLPYKQFTIDDAGAFRAPVLMPVLTKLFSKKDLQIMGPRKGGSIKTVIKIALPNVSGVLNIQKHMELNGDEWDIWQSAKKDKLASKWICPIIDCSKDLFPKLKESYSEMLFVQMPFCDTENIQEKLIDTFGIDKIESEFFDFCLGELPYDILKMKDDDLVKIIETNSTFSFLKNKTKTQLQNIKEISKVIQNYDINDLNLYNWGVLNGQMVIIDYSSARALN
jgi:hypothetical protein